MGDGDYCRSVTFKGDRLIFDTRLFPSIRGAQRGDGFVRSKTKPLVQGANKQEMPNQAEGPASPLENIVVNEDLYPPAWPGGRGTSLKRLEEPEDFLLYDYDTEDSDTGSSDMEDADFVGSDLSASVDKNKEEGNEKITNQMFAVERKKQFLPRAAEKGPEKEDEDDEKSTRHFYHDTDFTLENFERQPPAPETVNNDTTK